MSGIYKNDREKIMEAFKAANQQDIMDDLLHEIRYGGLLYEMRRIAVGKVFSLAPQVKDINAFNGEAIKRGASGGNIDIVKCLVKNGADIRVQNDCCLRWSAGSGHLDVVKYLVEQGADIHADDDQALRQSAKNGHFEVVKFLVEQGANIKDGAALPTAVKYFDIVKYLVEHGADIHYDDDEALRRSVRAERTEVAKYLVGQGADITAGIDELDRCRESLEVKNVEILSLLGLTTGFYKTERTSETPKPVKSRSKKM